MNKEHHVIIGPGLDGRINQLRFITRNWQRKYGLIPEIIPIIWKDNKPFKERLTKITDRIDSLVNKGYLVSLVGCSASGSAMLNAFIERKNVINKVVNLDGFLRPGNSRGFRSFERRTAKSPAFRESVLRFEKLESTLTAKDKRKILTVRPLFGDELVPADTVTIQGALNKTVPMGEHILSIATALVLYRPIIAFLKEDNLT